VAIERGYDLRLLCRELARATRDLLVASVDSGRLKDPDVASEAERARVQAVGARFSREDLLRTFDGFTRAEYDVRQSDHPRFQLEMALLRLMHLRKLLPLAELLEGGARGLSSPMTRPASPPASRPAVAAPVAAARPARPPARPTMPVSKAAAAPASAAAAAAPSVAATPGGSLPEGAREQYLAAVKSGKVFFYNAVVAQAHGIDVTPARITFSFLPNQKVPRSQCEENRAWLEALGTQVFGRLIPVHIALVDPAAAPKAPPPAALPAAALARPALKGPLAGPSEDELRQEALSDPTVQALLEIFPVERTKVEEM